MIVQDGNTPKRGTEESLTPWMSSGAALVDPIRPDFGVPMAGVFVGQAPQRASNSIALSSPLDSPETLVRSPANAEKSKMFPKDRLRSGIGERGLGGAGEAKDGSIGCVVRGNESCGKSKFAVERLFVLLFRAW